MAELIGRFDSDLLIDMIERIDKLDLNKFIKKANVSHEDIRPYEVLVELKYNSVENDESDYEIKLEKVKYEISNLIKVMIPEPIELDFE